MRTMVSDESGKSYTWHCKVCGRSLSFLASKGCEYDNGEGTWVPDGCLMVAEEKLA